MVTVASKPDTSLAQIEGGISRSEATAILIADRGKDAKGKVFKGILTVAVLGLLLLIIPDKVDFSLDIGNLKLDKVVGQKEVLCLLTTMMLYRLAADLSKFVHFANLYEHRMDIDFQDGGGGLVRNVTDDTVALQFDYSDKWGWKWIGRIELIRNVLIFLIVASSIGAAFVVTVVNIVKLFGAPAIGWPVSHVLLTVSVGLLLLFLTTLCEANVLFLCRVKEHRARADESKES